MNARSGIRTAMLPAELSIRSDSRFYLALAAMALMLLTIPQFARAQGIARGAREGAYEGSRVAGPVGGVVGGAVGAGVGGAVGAINGVFGIPNHGYRRGHRCHGFYDRYDHFHCYR